MKILQVAPLLTSTGDYGGPARVAINQSRGLMQLGHEVRLIAATWPDDPRPTSVDDVPVILFPGISLYPGAKLRALSSPLLIQWLRRHVSTYDVVHIHLARDLVTLPAVHSSAWRRIPVIAQPHGMLLASGNPAVKLVDRLMTYPLLQRVSALLYLTFDEQNMLRHAAPAVTLQPIKNGVDVVTSWPQALLQLSEIWKPNAQHRILFVGRLHPVKRPLDFVRMAAVALKEFPDADFLMVGPDQGLGVSVQKLIGELGLTASVRWVGALSHEEIQGLQSQAHALVLPSLSEQFPLAAVEAMAAGTPVVLTPNCGISEVIQDHGAGLIAQYSPECLAAALARFLRDEEYRRECGLRARGLVQSQMSAVSVARGLEQLYDATLRSR